MLNELRYIIEEVNDAANLQEALRIVTRRVRQGLNTNSCSIFMLDPQKNHYVFMATDGGPEKGLNSFSLKQGEGLIGRVASRMEPINLRNAQEHAAFHPGPVEGKDTEHSFLGVPIIYQCNVLGVIIAQRTEKKLFSSEEEAFLVTLSAQLAGLLLHARISGFFTPGTADKPQRNASFRGVSGGAGVAIGQAAVVAAPAQLERVPSRRCTDPESELQFFHRCLDKARADMDQLHDQMEQRLPPEELALFDAYSKILSDGTLGAEVEKRIRQGEWAQGALSQVVLEHARRFEHMDSDYLRERATDIKGLGCRVLLYLQREKDQPTPWQITRKAILVGADLTPAMLGSIPEGKIQGIVCSQGSRNSHIAIVARAMGIPTVMGVENLPVLALEGRPIILDGHNAIVIIDPDQKTLAKYQGIVAQDKKITKELENLWNLPCVTTDGFLIQLMVNTGLMSDISRSLRRGADGAGLYRTEIHFLLRDHFPTEEEQRRIYHKHLQAFSPKPVIMRTLDIGGDKCLPYFPIREDNPFLGWRGIRIGLDHPEIFLVQLRAMLSAAQGLDNLRIMLPMISNLSEFEDAMALIRRAYDELVDEGLSISMPPIGVMVEVPSAALQARALARRADFLSVGSNDLTQYMLAVDRNNARVADLYHSYHPAVLTLLNQIAQDAIAEQKPVHICGELAGDPVAAILLLAMGYDTLSMSVSNLLHVKSVLRRISLKDARKCLHYVLQLEDATAITEYMRDVIEASALGTA